MEGMTVQYCFYGESDIVFLSNQYENVILYVVFALFLNYFRLKLAMPLI